jgi:FlaA1/EpsC-like NDP-sugar epimerase
VLVLEMGNPVRIRELAQRMIHLSGLEVKDPQTGAGDIEIAYTGLRPGEKLYEELLISSNPELTQHPRIFKASENMVEWPELKSKLEELEQSIRGYSEGDVLSILMTLVCGFVRHTDAQRKLEPRSVMSTSKPLEAQHAVLKTIDEPLFSGEVIAKGKVAIH